MMDQQDKDAIFSAEPKRAGFEELLARYVEELPEKIATLTAARLAEDRLQVESQVHQLAGSLGLYGYSALERKCRALLARLRDGEAVEALVAQLTELEQELARVRARPSL